MTNTFRALCAAAAVIAAGCGNDNATAPTAPSTPLTENVSGALAVGGYTFHAFTISQGGTITVTLTNLSIPTLVTGLGVGSYNATDGVCSLNTSLNTAPGTAAQISLAADAGNYCVEIYDIGTLPAPIGFTFSIVHP